MKYCTKCGAQLHDEAMICISCGCATNSYRQSKAKASSGSGLKTAAKIFMIIGTVLMGVCVIPLAWCIPMTICYFNKVNNGEEVSTGFKVCSLIFVSMIGGILMLCEGD